MKNELKNPVFPHLRKNIPVQNLYNSIQKELIEVEDSLKSFTSSSNPIISEIGSYIFQKTGKRIRPALLLLCARMSGYKGTEHILMSTLVETIHTASLLHDDIIDNSPLRRGKESVHSKWGPNITVLMGDYLYIKTLRLALQSGHTEIMEALSGASYKMIEGELQEYHISGNLDLEEKEYMEVIRKKTASLFSASCQIGGVLGGASQKDKDAFKEYGMALGMAFQVIDDLLDYTGKEKSLGKPVLSDLSEGRVTLPLIYTIEHSGTSRRKWIAQLMKQTAIEASSQKKVLELVRSNGALDYTLKKAEEFSQKAKNITEIFSPSVYKDTLFLIPDFILTRKS